MYIPNFSFPSSLEGAQIYLPGVCGVGGCKSELHRIVNLTEYRIPNIFVHEEFPKTEYPTVFVHENFSNTEYIRSWRISEYQIVFVHKILRIPNTKHYSNIIDTYSNNRKIRKEKKGGKTKVKVIGLVLFKESPILIIQMAAAPKNGVEFCQMVFEEGWQ